MNSSVKANRSMTRRQIAFLWAAFGSTGVTAVLLASIFKSTSSTAAIGIIFIPFFAALFAVLFFIFAYCLPDLISCLKGRTAELPVLMKLRGAVAVVLLISGTSYLLYGILLSITVNRVQTLDASGINEFLERSIFRDNKYALGALAQNPNAPTSVLDRVAQIPNPELHQRMWSVWPVMGGNAKGLAVMRLIVRNSNVSTSTIEYLASSSQDDYVLGDISQNPKTSIETLRRLEGQEKYLIDWGLARNPKTPPDVLSRLLNREKHFTQRTTLEVLLGNQSTPSGIRNKASELLKEY